MKKNKTESTSTELDTAILKILNKHISKTEMPKSYSEWEEWTHKNLNKFSKDLNCKVNDKIISLTFTDIYYYLDYVLDKYPNAYKTNLEFNKM